MVEPFKGFGHELSVGAQQHAGTVEGIEPNGVEAELSQVSRQRKRHFVLR